MESHINTRAIGLIIKMPHSKLICFFVDRTVNPMHNRRQPKTRETIFGQRPGKSPTRGKTLSKFFFY